MHAAARSAARDDLLVPRVRQLVWQVRLRGPVCHSTASTAATFKKPAQDIFVLSERYLVNAPLLKLLFCLSVYLSVCL